MGVQINKTGGPCSCTTLRVRKTCPIQGSKKSGEGEQFHTAAGSCLHVHQLAPAAEEASRHSAAGQHSAKLTGKERGRGQLKRETMQCRWGCGAQLGGRGFWQPRLPASQPAAAASVFPWLPAEARPGQGGAGAATTPLLGQGAGAVTTPLLGQGAGAAATPLLLGCLAACCAALGCVRHQAHVLHLGRVLQPGRGGRQAQGIPNSESVGLTAASACAGSALQGQSLHITLHTPCLWLGHPACGCEQQQP